MNAMEAMNQKAREKALALLQPTPAQLEHGLELHKESLVVDAFGFAPYSLTRRAIEALNRLNEQGSTLEAWQDRRLAQRVLDKAHDPEAREQCAIAWRDAGVTGTMQTCGGQEAVSKTIRHFSRFFYVWDRMPEQFQKATTSEDVRQAKAEGRHCQFISLNGVPGLHEVEPDAVLDMVDNFYHFGCRMMHLTYNLRNVIGDGCVERANAGLSEFGREVVQRMNEVGVLVDTPHSGRQTTLDAARASQAPVAASHTACQSVYAHDRGKSDEELKAIADTGGFVGICAIPYFLAQAGTIVDMLDHIDYLVRLVGADHAAIGTDVGALPDKPEDLKVKGFPGPRPKNRNWRPEHISSSPKVSDECRSGSLRWTNWPYFTVGLVQRGYSDDDIRKIIGGNVLRTLDEVARCADR